MADTLKQFNIVGAVAVKKGAINRGAVLLCKSLGGVDFTLTEACGSDDATGEISVYYL